MNKTMKKLSGLMFLVLFFLPTFGQEKITLKIASIAPARSPWDIELRKLAAEWTKITNGQVVVRFQNMVTLGGEKAGIQKMKSPRPGQRAPLDGAIFSSMGLHELVPDAKIFTLSIPFLIRNQKELSVVIDQFGPTMEAKFADKGVELLAWTNAGWITFFTKDEFKNLEELKKLKIACSGFDSPVLSNSLKTAGFTVEDIPSSKIPQSLKSNSGVNGLFSVPMLIYMTGLYKDLHHMLGIRLCPVMAGLAISQDSWNRIPEKYKAAMQKAMDQTIKNLNAELEHFDVDYTKKLQETGINLVSVTNSGEKEWDNQLTEDMKKASRAYPEVLDIDMYSEIKGLLETYRK